MTTLSPLSATSKSSHAFYFSKFAQIRIFSTSSTFWVYFGTQSTPFYSNVALSTFTWKLGLIWESLRNSSAKSTDSALVKQTRASPFGFPVCKSSYILTFYLPVFKSSIIVPHFCTNSTSSPSETSKGRPVMYMYEFVLDWNHFYFFCIFYRNFFYLLYSRFSNSSQFYTPFSEFQFDY